VGHTPAADRSNQTSVTCASCGINLSTCSMDRASLFLGAVFCGCWETIRLRSPSRCSRGPTRKYDTGISKHYLALANWLATNTTNVLTYESSITYATIILLLPSWSEQSVEAAKMVRVSRAPTSNLHTSSIMVNSMGADTSTAISRTEIRRPMGDNNFGTTSQG